MSSGKIHVSDVNMAEGTDWLNDHAMDEKQEDV